MCKLCEKNPVYEFTNQRRLCKNCYIRWFEKKFLYTIRKFNLIKKSDTILIPTKKDFRSAVLKNLFTFYTEKNPYIKIVKSKTSKYNKTASKETTDLIAYKITKAITNKKIKELKSTGPKEKNIIRPLYLFLDKEVLLYAKLKKIKHLKPKTKKKDKIENIIETLEQKHPEIKQAIVQSGLKLG